MMRDDEDAGAPKRTGIAAVVMAESTAEETVGRARAEAERSLEAAKERARQIREASAGGGSPGQAERDAETTDERGRIFEAARRRIDEMRRLAEAREPGAAENLLALLFGRS